MIAPTVTGWETTKLLGSRQIEAYSPECVQEFSANRACVEFCEVCLRRQTKGLRYQPKSVLRRS
jgi:hypothetical protein